MVRYMGLKVKVAGLSSSKDPAGQPLSEVENQTHSSKIQLYG